MGPLSRPWVLLRRAAFPPAAAAPLLRRHLATKASANLVYALAATAADRSEAPLFHLPPELRRPPARSPVLTYGDFWTLVRQTAACLAQLGLEKGDRLAAQVTKRPENVALYLATLQLGAIYLPLNTDYTFEEVRYFLANATPALFVCRTESIEEYLRLSAATNEPFTAATNGCSKAVRKTQQIIDESELARLSEDCGPLEDICPVGSSAVASICYTSGTTGKPKGAMISHGNLGSNAAALVGLWEMSPADVLLHALPIYHVHGLFVALNSALLAGAAIHFLPRFEIGAVLDRLSDATMMMGVPTYYFRLLDSPKFGAALLSPSFRLFISGSAPLLAGVWEAFRERSGGQRILERYGMTEGQMVCSNPVQGDRVPETVGFPLPGVEARVVDGVLHYRGPNVFLGYWGMPEKTKTEFTEDGWFISGDLAEMEPDGRVRIIGRGKDLIISGGLNVYPKEVEDVIDVFPGVKESAVVGVPHPDWGEVGVAVIVPSESGTSPDTEALITHVRSELAGYKVPKSVEIIESLPRNAMGKIQKNVLRQQFKNTFTS